MDVTFATPGGREFTVEVWYFATVREIKETVHAREGIPVASQRLFLEDGGGDTAAELDDARDTEHYGMIQGSRLVLVIPDDAPPPRSPSPSPSPPSPAPAAVVRVAVSCSGPEIEIGPCSVDFPASDTVARLKELLQDRTDGALPAARTALFLAGKAEMEDGKALADYDPPSDGGIMDVSAVVRPQPAAPVASGGGGGNDGAGARIELNVTCGETAVALEVGAMDVVRDLRKEVERLRLPVRDGTAGGGGGGYFFVYKQNTMDEDRTLRWHEVKNGDTIEIFNGTVTGGARLVAPSSDQGV